MSLLDPLEVKGLHFKNRIVMSPLATGLATSEGIVTDKLIEHYVRRSGALGLLIVEHTIVSIEGKSYKNALGIWNDSLILGLKRLASSVHATGTPVVQQINHGGRRAKMEVTGTMSAAPSSSEKAPWKRFADREARELKVEEIEALAEAFEAAAGRAIKAGFDGVEVHGCHGYLLNQFFSPITNRRGDKYGGSFDNRIRFPLEVVERIREKIGEKLLLYRLGSDDLEPQGNTIEDSKEFAVRLEKAGVDLIDVSGGLCGSRPTQLKNRQGYFIPQAQQIKKVVNVPIIGVGGITEPEYANKVIQQGQVDLVAVSRALLKDPEWAIKTIKKLKNAR